MNVGRVLVLNNPQRRGGGQSTSVECSFSMTPLPRHGPVVGVEHGAHRALGIHEQHLMVVDGLGVLHSMCHVRRGHRPAGGSLRTSTEQRSKQNLHSG